MRGPHVPLLATQERRKTRVKICGFLVWDISHKEGLFFTHFFHGKSEVSGFLSLYLRIGFGMPVFGIYLYMGFLNFL